MMSPDKRRYMLTRASDDVWIASSARGEVVLAASRHGAGTVLEQRPGVANGTDDAVQKITQMIG